MLLGLLWSKATPLICYHIVPNLVIIEFFQNLLRTRTRCRYRESIQKLLIADKCSKLNNLSIGEGKLYLLCLAKKAAGKSLIYALTAIYNLGGIRIL
jgi:hypothetical protein